MIIDQLPLLAGNALTTDEIPVERGTTSYKAALSQLLGTVYSEIEPNFAGAYDDTSTYAVGDFVIYEHELYKCNTAITTAEAWTAAHWTQVSVADELLAVYTAIASKQDTLVSGTNIKTVGGQSLLGSGNIDAGGALYFTSVTVSATTGNIATVSNAAITEDHVVASVVFANSNYITTDVSWTTSSGSLVLNGTCSTATTCNIVLVKKNN